MKSATEKHVAVYAAAAFSVLLWGAVAGGCSASSDTEPAPATEPASVPDVANAPSPAQASAPVAAEAKSPSTAPVPVAVSTAIPELRAFAHECDRLLAELDEAHETRRLATSIAEDNGASWGVFARDFNARAELLGQRAKEFTPRRTKLLVGTVPGYLVELFHKLLDPNPRKYLEYRTYVATLIDERDAHLAELDPPPDSDMLHADSETAQPSAALAQTAADAGRAPEGIASPEPREFTDSTGNFRVTATLIATGDGVVRLRKLDGSEITVPLDRLSSTDQDWIAKGESQSQ